MNTEEKLLDAFGILIDLQNRTYEKLHTSTESLSEMKRDIQEIRIDTLQIRSALQQLHQDLVRMAYGLTLDINTEEESKKS